MLMPHACRQADDSRLFSLVALVCLAVLGCNTNDLGTEPSNHAFDSPDVSLRDSVNEEAPSVPASEEIVFKDEVSSNATVPEQLSDLVFIDTNGDRVALQDYLEKKNVILVFTEGFSGMLCPYCKTQTSRLIANYDKFAELDTEILVVYPGERDHVSEFLEAARTGAKRQLEKVPFPVVLDEKMDAVEFFEIRSQLAHPSTYVIDKKGNVRLAYVGQDMSADRPSISALLRSVKVAGESQ